MKKLLFVLMILALCVPAALAEYPPRIGTVTEGGGDWLSVRAGHDTESEILGEVHSGFRFSIRDTYQSKGEPYPWYKVTFSPMQKEGWIYGQFVKELDKYEANWYFTAAFTNNTSETVMLAIASEADGGDGRPGAHGWYSIEAGDTIGVDFFVDNEAIGPNHPAMCRYYAKSGNRVWGGDEDRDMSYVIHPTKDFWCVRGDEGLYGEAGGEKYDLGKGQREPEGCESVPFKDLPKDEGFYIGKVTFE
ncbi:MAG: SH3 domain-containing protein [Synergistaceae bacterium]|jgi:hypothetical protein|nr:SH3 domain-containing protein [Synergistaceae bacterium]